MGRWTRSDWAAPRQLDSAMDQNSGVIMSHQWEHEDDLIKLALASNKAKREGDIALYEELQTRIKVFEDIMWQSKVAVFKELSPFSSIADALYQKSVQLQISFLDLTNSRNNTGDGKFIFGVSDELRTVQIWPMEDRGYYNVDLFDYEFNETGDCYKGHTRSLEEATIVVSRWFVERCSIHSLHEQFLWLSNTPFVVSGPRMTFE